MQSFKFPHISRFFSANITKSLLSWTKLIASWAAVGLLINVNRLVPPQTPTSGDDQSVLGASVATLTAQTQFAYWKKLIEEKPDYRDAYIMAASLAHELGNDEEAMSLINRALTLDPNSTQARELLKRLEDSNERN